MAALAIVTGLVIAIPSTLLVGGGVLLHGRLDWSLVTLLFGLGMTAFGVWAFRWDPSH
jgi:putative Ca2+/H+ antiporter (TMEM165/GDT1 family)